MHRQKKIFNSDGVTLKTIAKKIVYLCIFVCAVFCLAQKAQSFLVACQNYAKLFNKEYDYGKYTISQKSK